MRSASPRLRDARVALGLLRRRRLDVHAAPQQSAEPHPALRRRYGGPGAWVRRLARQRDALQELVDRTEPVRALTGARLCIVRTNSKELRLQKWEDSCGAQLAACLHLFSADFSHALIGGSDAYDELWLPWGTNPVTDHLLSGGRMAIVHDGAAFCRTDKIAFLRTCRPPFDR